MITIAATTGTRALLPESEKPIADSPAKDSVKNANAGIITARDPNLSLSMPPKNKPITAETAESPVDIPVEASNRAKLIEGRVPPESE